VTDEGWPSTERLERYASADAEPAPEPPPEGQDDQTSALAAEEGSPAPDEAATTPEVPPPPAAAVAEAPPGETSAGEVPMVAGTRSGEAAGGAVELYLLRHADAGDPAEWPGHDADRPLSKRGRKQAKRLATLLADLDWKPDVVLTSPKVRAFESARIVGRKVGIRPKPEPRLADGFDGADVAVLLEELPAAMSRVVLVGHDPDFSGLASWLIGAPLSLRKGAIARFDLPDRSIGAGRGLLRWLLPPDAIPD
jgi:phosphohistidine phosphatase